MPSSSDVEDSLLESACELLKHDWVKSFLFPTDRSTYVRQLHHAVSQPNAITAAVHFGTQSSSVGPCQSVSGLDRKLSLLCVPSFSTGNITVGFEITECLSDASPRPLGIPRYTARYVRDDDEGLMLIIAEHPHLGVTEVTCCTLVSPGCRSQVYALMNLRKLRAVVSNLDHTNGYDASIMRRATVFAYSSVDMRACPNCGRNTVALCACRRRVKQKAHPLDHVAERENLSTFTGDFGGLARMKVINDGQESSATFVSKIEAIFTYDRENQRMLSRWAMTNAFSTEPVRLGNYQMPGEKLLIEQGEGSDATTNGEDSASSRDVLCQTVGQREKRQRGYDAKELPVRRRIRKSCASSPKRSALSSALFTGSTVGTAEEGSPCTPITESKTSLHGSDHMETSLVPEGIPLARSIRMRAPSVAKPPLPKSTRQTAVGTQAMHGLSNGMLLVPVRAVYQAVVPMPQGVPLAPAPLTTAGCKVYRDTRSKDEIRRARNRASAQRSNEKKKREVEKLKDDLEEFVKRKEVLVEREQVLRRENAVLRAALGDCGCDCLDLCAV